MTEKIIKREQQKKEKLIKGALAEFAKHGYSKVTMDEMAAQLGTSKKTIYKYFPSKEDLLKATMDYRQGCIKELIFPIIAEESDFISKLAKVGSTVATMLSEAPLTLIIDLNKNARDLWTQCMVKQRESTMKGFGEFIGIGIKEGYIRTDIPVELMTEMYVSCMQSLFNPEFISNSGYKPAELYKALIKLFFEGIMTEEGRAGYLDNLSLREALNPGGGPQRQEITQLN